MHNYRLFEHFLVGMNVRQEIYVVEGKMVIESDIRRKSGIHFDNSLRGLLKKPPIRHCESPKGMKQSPNLVYEQKLEIATSPRLGGSPRNDEFFNNPLKQG